MSNIDDILDINKVKIKVEIDTKRELAEGLVCYNFTYIPGRFLIPVILRKEDILSGKKSLISIAINNIITSDTDHFLINYIKNRFRFNGTIVYVNNIRVDMMSQLINIYYNDGIIHAGKTTQAEFIEYLN